LFNLGKAPKEKIHRMKVEFIQDWIAAYDENNEFIACEGLLSGIKYDSYLDPGVELNCFETGVSMSDWCQWCLCREAKHMFTNILENGMES
jgi:hypothetical protein